LAAEHHLVTGGNRVREGGFQAENQHGFSSAGKIQSELASM
jgi:hypothetical protein